MDISATLDKIRARHAGCRTLAFADISTKMVLCVSSLDRPDQEFLDALCATAADMLDGELCQQMAPLITKATAPDLQHAVVLQPDEVVIFVRSPHCREETLLGLCAPNADLNALLGELSSEIDMLTRDDATGVQAP